MMDTHEFIFRETNEPRASRAAFLPLLRWPLAGLALLLLVMGLLKLIDV